jgi:integrase/recombinase XerD
MSSTVKVVLFKGKKLKNGEHPIMIRVIKDRRSSYLSVGSSCSIRHWDFKNNIPKKNHPNYEELLVLIDRKRSEANKLLLGIKTENEDISADEIKSRLISSTVKSKQTVVQYFNSFIARMESANRHGYADTFKFTRNSLLTFNENNDFSFGYVTPSFLIKYEEYLTGKTLAPNSIFLYLRTFKTLVNYARIDGVVAKSYDPFNNISFAKYRNVKTRKRALPKDVILKILNLGIEVNDPIYDFWNYFRFSYLCWGINFIDMAYLRWENIQESTLQYTRQKTGDEFNILLTKEALDILNYYRTAKLNPKVDFVFPIFNETHETPLSKSYRVKKVRKQYNSALKTIAEMLAIPTKLTSYVARHSFANVLRQSGVSVTIIKDALGHESEAMTEVYTSQLDASILGNTINNSLL